MKKGTGAKKAAIIAADTTKSAAHKAELISKAAEEDITEQLFACDLGTDASGLKQEKDYTHFARQVSDVLLEGQAPYHIPAFFKEMLTDWGKKQATDSLKIKKVLDACTVVYNQKIAEEKKAEGGGKSKGKQKPKIAAGKNTTGLDRNNNSAMVADLIGGEEDDYYGEQYYDEEADPTEGGKKRVPEAEYDFF